MERFRAVSGDLKKNPKIEPLCCQLFVGPKSTTDQGQLQKSKERTEMCKKHTLLAVLALFINIELREYEKYNEYKECCYRLRDLKKHVRF